MPLAVVLVATYALLARVRFPIGYGFTIPTQVVLVPMLFLLPLGAVPLFVAAGMVLGGLPEYLFGDRHPSRAISAVADAWHSVGPVACWPRPARVAPRVRRVGDPGSQRSLPRWSVDNAGATLREWAGHGISPKLQPALFGWVDARGTCCSRPGRPDRGDGGAVSEPYAVLLVLPLAALLFVFALERSARMRQAIELSRAYRGTTLLLSDVLEVDDEYTGFHSRSVVVARRWRSPTPGPRRRGSAATSSSARCFTTWARSPVPKEIINKPGPLTDDEWLVMQDAHDRGPADARPRGRPAQRGRPDRPLLAREVGTAAAIRTA